MRRAVVCIVMGIMVLCADGLAAQQIRYMDSAGNIHFVDSLNQVPPRYRSQLITPTPVPILDKKARAEKRRQEQLAQQEKIVQEKRKRAEELQKKREEAKKKKEEARKNQSKGRTSGFGRVM